MGCCNFGKEDEMFPFEEEANKWIEGILPQWKANRDYTIPTTKDEIEKRLKKFKRLIYDENLESKLEVIININSRIDFLSENGKIYVFIVKNYLFPFLEKLIYYKANEPEGKEELLFLIESIEKNLSVVKVKNFDEKINRTFDILISALYEQLC
ncbi:hypothetical protein Dester_0901 [Desulfurobacterium thermolithotrophum DSM 11699]|uniref:Uncharacterized protein n=1 Tax=Desulfurobacterium thermolithotrophum (strain DSM 11699 / BSA) TaxID=868864 RepID=F0S3W9_DESTD|nr:hypothetical protein [Desulfurobacterium thermolithotrophum]ADY73541.1 hypothetical protein Dester_0901 [Desulfurobacterium thermolithotrophum DSM 11699]